MSKSQLTLLSKNRLDFLEEAGIIIRKNPIKSVMIERIFRKRALTATIISALIPGGGQLYRRRYIAGGIILTLFWGGIYLHVPFWCVYIIYLLNLLDAYKGSLLPPVMDCPLRMRRTQEFKRLLKQGKVYEAACLMWHNTVLPCTLRHFCTGKCSREGECIPEELWKKLCKYSIETRIFPTPYSPRYRELVAVVGGGLGGLTVAYFLQKRGYQVVVMEKTDTIGGMLNYLPEFYLPSFYRNELRAILDTGVEIRYNTDIGKDTPIAKLLSVYDAVILATGRDLVPKLPVIPGQHLKGTMNVLQFLARAKRSNKRDWLKGKRVIVVGDGREAGVAALTAHYFGAKTTLLTLKPILSLGARLREMIRHKDIDVKHTKAIKALLGKNDYVEEIALQESKLAVDIVISALPRESSWKSFLPPLFSNITPTKEGYLTQNLFITGEAYPKGYGEHEPLIETIIHARKCADAVDRFIRGRTSLEQALHNWWYDIPAF